MATQTHMQITFDVRPDELARLERVRCELEAARVTKPWDLRSGTWEIADVLRYALRRLGADLRFPRAP